MLQHCIPNFLERADTPSLANKRINNMMMCIFKCINFTNYAAYLKGLFQFGTSDHSCSLRCMNVLVLPNPKQLHMPLFIILFILFIGLNSVRYAAVRF